MADADPEPGCQPVHLALELVQSMRSDRRWGGRISDREVKHDLMAMIVRVITPSLVTVFRHGSRVVLGGPDAAVVYAEVERIWAASLEDGTPGELLRVLRSYREHPEHWKSPWL